MKLQGLILFVIFAASSAALAAAFKEDTKNRKLMFTSIENKFATVYSNRLENLNSVRNNGVGDGASHATEKNGIKKGSDQLKESNSSDENDGRNGSRGSTTDSHHSIDLRNWHPGSN